MDAVQRDRSTISSFRGNSETQHIQSVLCLKSYRLTRISRLTSRHDNRWIGVLSKRIAVVVSAAAAAAAGKEILFFTILYSSAKAQTSLF